ncbi:probable transcription factor At5g28040 [Quercus robur]|uniref:probable transcription factor At5g28040 n=1 Tax=Quercus robur TaxID=38942 RepID=UPI00216127C5|nr:probable transcription factor At5g28040 [Quercus robur]
MLSSLVGWIIPSSSSSSSSSSQNDEKEDDNTKNDSISAKPIDNIDESIDDPKIPVGIAVRSTPIVTIALPAAAAAPLGNPPITATTTTTTIIVNSKRQRVENENKNDAWAMQEEKRHVDCSRRLIQRIWTNEDEIELLRGFLEFTTQRGSTNYNVTKEFYDQIRSKLQVEFNKNQLSDKLSKLKRKYKRILEKINPDKEFSFKTAHEQARFEISRKIWGDIVGRIGVEDNMLDEDEPSSSLNDINLVNVKVEDEEVMGDFRPWKRPKSLSSLKINEKHVSNNGTLPNDIENGNNDVASLIEDTVKSLSPLFQELLSNALSPTQLSPDGVSTTNMQSGEAVDEKWKEQKIKELEVYSKRLELVQDQIKATLEELKSMGG